MGLKHEQAGESAHPIDIGESRAGGGHPDTSSQGKAARQCRVPGLRFLVYSSPMSTFPSVVMIIRHGEKPGDPSNDSSGGADLSIFGSARAAALAQLFTPNPAQPSAELEQLMCSVAAGSTGQFSGTYSFRRSAGRGTAFSGACISLCDRDVDEQQPANRDDYTDLADPESPDRRQALRQGLWKGCLRYSEQLQVWRSRGPDLLASRQHSSPRAGVGRATKPDHGRPEPSDEVARNGV